MKFIANTETIRNLLSIVTRALSVRPSQPVLEGVLIEVRENCLLLTASDGMFTIHASTEVNEVEPGRLLAPGRFLETLRKLPDGEMTASQTKSGGLTLSCAGAHITIGCQNGEEYPDLPEIVEPHSFSLEQKMLRDMINESSFCIADEDPRVVLTGALLEVSEGRFAHGGAGWLPHGRAQPAVRRCEPRGKRRWWCPKPLIEIARLLTEEEEETVLLQIDRNYISAQLSSVPVLRAADRRGIHQLPAHPAHGLENPREGELRSSPVAWNAPRWWRARAKTTSCASMWMATAWWSLPIRISANPMRKLKWRPTANP